MVSELARSRARSSGPVLADAADGQDPACDGQRHIGESKVPTMSVMTFIASLVSTLAWPVIVLVLAVLFRRQIGGLVHNLAERVKHLTKVQTPAGSAEFDNQLIRVKEDIAPIVRGEEEKAGIPTQEATALESTDELSVSTTQHESPNGSADHPAEPNDVTREFKTWVSADHIVMDNSDLREMREESPEAMLLGAWSRLEVTINLIAFNLRINVKKRSFLWAALAVIDRLHAAGVLEDAPNAASVVTRLGHMRNSVAHSKEEITKLQAYEYAVSALQISNLLINAYNRLPPERSLWQTSPANSGDHSPPSS